MLRTTLSRSHDLYKDYVQPKLNTEKSNYQKLSLAYKYFQQRKRDQLCTREGAVQSPARPNKKQKTLQGQDIKKIRKRVCTTHAPRRMVLSPIIECHFVTLAFDPRR